MKNRAYIAKQEVKEKVKQRKRNPTQTGISTKAKQALESNHQLLPNTGKLPFHWAINRKVRQRSQPTFDKYVRFQSLLGQEEKFITPRHLA